MLYRSAKRVYQFETRRIREPVFWGQLDNLSQSKRHAGWSPFTVPLCESLLVVPRYVHLSRFPVARDCYRYRQRDSGRDHWRVKAEDGTALVFTAIQLRR